MRKSVQNLFLQTSFCDNKTILFVMFDKNQQPLFSNKIFSLQKKVDQKIQQQKFTIPFYSGILAMTKKN